VRDGHRGGGVNRARVTPGFVAANTAFLWLTMAVAATALWPIYRTSALVVLVAVALAAGSIIAILGAVFRWPSPVVLLVSVLAFLAIGVPLAVPSKALLGVLPTPGGLVDLVSGVALGWKQLITITLPVGDYEALLVPALVLVFGGTTVGLTVALRARFGEAGVIAPVVVFIAAIAFGPQFPERPVVVAIALLVAVLFWLVWFRWYRRRRAVRLLAVASDGAGARVETGFAGLRTVVSAGVILALAAGGAVVAAQALPPGTDRTVLRTSIQQPFDPRDHVSPLAGFRSFWQPGVVDEVLFDVTGLPDGGRIRLATLDTWDGVVYSVGSDRITSESGSFTRVPSSFDQSDVAGDRVTIDVSIAAYEGVWLPTIGQFESVRFTALDPAELRESFVYNDVSGTAAVIGGVGTGDGYEFTAVVPRQPSDTELVDLEPGSAVVPEPAEAPEELTAKLEQYTARVEGAGARLVAALEGLAAEGYISHGVSDDEPPSRSGHASDRIAELLSARRMIGDAEQYAVTAALMAAELGFPSRVVMGFAPTGSQVRGGDVAAWIEVSTEQFGWVAIDPTPPVREIPDELPEDNTQVARPPTIVPPTVIEEDPLDRQSTPESEQELPPDLDPILQGLFAALRVAGWVLLVAAILTAPFLLVVAAKLRRRWLRRRAPTPLARIRGGWQEFEDAVVDRGLSPVASATRSEVASIAGGAQSQVLAAVADRAVFAPGEPDAGEAENVWRAVDELQSTLDEGLTLWQRLRARVSVRSLGGYSVSRLFKR
jgi:transglutaminase-like putative cysteine protease